MKLLGYMWDRNYKDYPNLCPLFWTLVGSIAILPFYVIIRPFFSCKPLYNLVSFIGKICGYMGLGFMLGLFWLITDFLTTYVLYENRLEYEYVWIKLLVGIVAVVSILVGIAALIVWTSYKYEKHIESKPRKIREKKSSVIVSYIKSVYHKNCPFINWK